MYIFAFFIVLVGALLIISVSMIKKANDEPLVKIFFILIILMGIFIILSIPAQIYIEICNL